MHHNKPSPFPCIKPRGISQIPVPNQRPDLRRMDTIPHAATRKIAQRIRRNLPFPTLAKPIGPNFTQASCRCRVPEEEPAEEDEAAKDIVEQEEGGDVVKPREVPSAVGR